MIRDCLSVITNCNMTDTTWMQATLPVGKGGLGIRRTEELALSAFLASVHSVSGLISMIFPGADVAEITRSPTDAWCQVTGLPAPPTILQSVQRLWDAPQVEATFNKYWPPQPARLRRACWPLPPRNLDY